MMAKNKQTKVSISILKTWELIAYFKKKIELKSAKVRVTMQFYNKSIELRSNGR